MGYLPPETSSFVGRGPELGRLATALARHRLVTLTGPGGVGKTRLAQRAALAATAVGGPGAADRPDGAGWADLSALDGPELLAATLSDAVDLADHSALPRTEALAAWLADRRVLLVLDSCEHLAEECARTVAELLAAAPGLTVLATSRRPLNCPGEHLVEVAPLAPDGPDAVALFRDRVAGAGAGALLDEPGADGAVQAICRALEGIPLAIELAAGRVGPTPVGEVATALASRFEVLAREDGDEFVWPRRHRTLRTTVGWSHELCAPLERLLWARLSVFRGAFGLADARAVAAGGPLDDDQVAPVLERLAAQSVVHRTAGPDGEDRYRLLDTIREYGQGWLRELGEERAAADRHALHFTGLARWADAVWPGRDQLLGYRRVEEAHADLRAALDHLLAADPAAAAELAGLLVYFWTCCGHLKEARGYLEQALAAHTVPGPRRTRALIGLGATLTLHGDHAAARAVDARVRAALDADPDSPGDGTQRLAAACLTGLLGLLSGRPQEALDATREALAAVPGTPFDSPDRLRCTLAEVLSLTVLGRFDEGRQRALVLRRLCVRGGELWTRSYLDYQLSVVALFSGVPAEAAGYARTMLRAKAALGDAFGIALGLDLLSAALAADGRPEEAAAFYGAGGAYWRSVGHPQRGARELEPVRQRCEETLRAELGDEGYAAACARGAAASGPEVLAAAVGRQGPEGPEEPAGAEEPESPA